MPQSLGSSLLCRGTLNQRLGLTLRRLGGINCALTHRREGRGSMLTRSFRSIALAALALLCLSVAGFVVASDSPSTEPKLTEEQERDFLLHARSEEHTSELQSRGHLVCRLLLEKKKQTKSTRTRHHARPT